MKTRKYNNKLIQLQILKLQYKAKSSFFRTSLKQTELYLNKIANVVYKYHLTDKKILFIGFPEEFTKILINTKHLVLPEYMWFNGMLSNRTLLSSSGSKSNPNKHSRMSIDIHQLLLRLKKKFDLVVVCNLSSEATAIKESYISRVPVITLSGNLNILDSTVTYKSPEDFKFVDEKMLHNNIYYSVLKTTLRRAVSMKKTKNLRFRSVISGFFQRKVGSRSKSLKRERTLKKQKSFKRQ